MTSMCDFPRCEGHIKIIFQQDGIFLQRCAVVIERDSIWIYAKLQVTVGGTRCADHVTPSIR
jgi:hypothetical protein